ncbi:hypothetical protein GE061_016035 [Apolygus lucorum]|uniref:Uncharacterized protein n=1 Tax=Apolygus lucorum TaxID=248454 RepID=A0A8S9XH43_APOLU|nr:hypothetical protein GE061_016035 [Apolygus lucorum]
MLRRKRLKERERYAKIKNDPAPLKLRQESLAENYVKRKATLKVRMVSQMSNRELRAKRKQWRNNTRSHRAAKKFREAEARFVRENSPASSSADEGPRAPQVPQAPVNAGGRNSSARKKVRCEKAKMSRANKKLKKENAKLKRSLEKERKRIYRFKKSMGMTDSPNTKVNRIMKEKNKAKIRRQLLFGETLIRDLNDTYKTIKSHQKKKAFRTFVVGKARFRLEIQVDEPFPKAE